MRFLQLLAAAAVLIPAAFAAAQPAPIEWPQGSVECVRDDTVQREAATLSLAGNVRATLEALARRTTPTVAVCAALVAIAEAEVSGNGPRRSGAQQARAFLRSIGVTDGHVSRAAARDGATNRPRAPR